MKYFFTAFFLISISTQAKDPSGFKLTSMKKQSVYEKLGLKQGDIIKTVNGKPMNSPQDAAELTDLMKTADKIEVELIRNGTPQKMTYQLK